MPTSLTSTPSSSCSSDTLIPIINFMAYQTIEDAITTCQNSEINYLYVPADQDIHIPYSMIKPKKKELFELEDES